jgi:hypothetical protein
MGSYELPRPDNRSTIGPIGSVSRARKKRCSEDRAICILVLGDAMQSVFLSANDRRLVGLEQALSPQIRLADYGRLVALRKKTMLIYWTNGPFHGL